MIALIPGQRLTFHLPIHQEIPAARRPTFHAKAWTCVEFVRAQELLGRVGVPGDEASVALLCMGLVGWSNVYAADGAPVAFDPARLADLASPVEYGEVINGVFAAQRPSVGDEKKSASRSQSSTGASAADASAAAVAS